MPKRILLAESNDVTREVAESALRQNGFEVISVATAEKTNEVLEYSCPDLIVVSADIETAEQKPLYSQLLKNRKFGHLPLLLIESAEGRSVTLPDEVVIQRPIDTKEFVKRAKALLKPVAGSARKAPNPLDDEFLDSALGLDNLNVTDAEDMDKSTIQKRTKSKANAGQMVGYSSNPSDEGDTTNNSRVESLIIEDDDSIISHKKKVGQPSGKLSSTGGLELSTDQYGLTEAPVTRSGGNDNPQDYNSFLDSLRDDGDGGPVPSPAKSSGSGGLKFNDTSSLLNPIKRENQPTPVKKPAQSASDTSGIEQFIDEFKKEIEELRSEDSDEKVVPKVATKGADKSKNLDWQDSVEMLEEEAVNLFVRQFSTQLADKVSKDILAKIDGEKFIAMLRTVIIEDKSRKSRQ